MRRRFLVLMIVALMATMMVVVAAPAMALGSGSGSVVQIDPFNNLLQDVPPNPISLQRDSITVAYPTDVIRPVLEHNPNVVRECSLDVCP